MNNLHYLLILSSLTSLLVMGPNLVPVKSYAAVDIDGDYKTTKDYKDSIKKDIYAESDKTDQHLDQDNLCYRDDGCEQANEGEQVEGKDNTASGFNDQSKSIEQQQQQQSAVSTAPIPGTPGNGTSLTPTPTPPTAITLAPTSALSGVTSTPTPTPPTPVILPSAPTAVTLAPTSALSQPDDECLFEPSLPKCAPGEDGKCPSGFNMNGDGNCFPDKPCPSGYENHDYDETGNAGVTPTPTPTPSQPDDECLFEPSLPKCAPGGDGKCPSGFNMNGDGNCFPDKPCPSGYENHDYDETGKCWSKENPTPTPTTSTLTVDKHVECNFTSTIVECPTAN